MLQIKILVQKVVQITMVQMLIVIPFTMVPNLHNAQLQKVEWGS